LFFIKNNNIIYIENKKEEITMWFRIEKVSDFAYSEEVFVSGLGGLKAIFDQYGGCELSIDFDRMRILVIDEDID